MIQASKGAWICCQIGARQHYTVPLALHQRRSLESLITDLWVCPKSLLALLSRHLAGRFCPELKDTTVYASNGRALAFAVQAHLRGLDRWRLIEERNEWFQEYAL